MNDRLARARQAKSIRAMARKYWDNMDEATRLRIYEAVGVHARNRAILALDYLTDPVHLAQFKLEVRDGKAVLCL